MAREASHLYRLLALLDPLLGRAPLVIEPYHRPARRLQISHDESHSREQLPSMELHLRHHTPRRLPTGRLIQKALVPDHGLVARAANVTNATPDRVLTIRDFVERVYFPHTAHYKRPSTLKGYRDIWENHVAARCAGD